MSKLHERIKREYAAAVAWLDAVIFTAHYIDGSMR